jgi:hypothetical protein
MTYTLEIPIEAAHMAEAEKKAWRMLGGLPPGTPFRLALEGPGTGNEPAQPAQGQRAWTRAELSLIEDGIVPASRRYDAEFVAAVKAKAEGGAR